MWCSPLDWLACQTPASAFATMAVPPPSGTLMKTTLLRCTVLSLSILRICSSWVLGQRIVGLCTKPSGTVVLRLPGFAHLEMMIKARRSCMTCHPLNTRPGAPQAGPYRTALDSASACWHSSPNQVQCSPPRHPTKRNDGPEVYPCQQPLVGLSSPLFVCRPCDAGVSAR